MKCTYAGIVAAGLALAACSDGGTGPAPRQTGTITGQVVDVDAGNAGVPSVSVQFVGSSTQTVVTGTGGNFTLSNAAAGAWSATLQLPSSYSLATSESGTRTATVTGGQTATLTPFRMTQSQSQVLEIRLSGTTFVDGTITIAPGTTVRWINEDGQPHTVTPENSGQSGVWQRWETSSAGTVFEHTFSVPNQTYRYRCEPHSTNFTTGMVGTITVTA